MKKICLFFILITAFAFEIKAQTNQKIGFGYFGNTLTYPGAVVEYELEKMFSEKASLPLRADVGFYYHKRYNTGLLQISILGSEGILSPVSFWKKVLVSGSLALLLVQMMFTRLMKKGIFPKPHDMPQRI